MQSCAIRGEQVCERGTPSHTLKGERCDEILGRARQNNVDNRAQASEVTGDLNTLIGGDAAGHPQHDTLALPGPARCERSAGHQPPTPLLGLVAAPALHEAKLDLTGGQSLERARRQLLLFTERHRVAG